MKLKKFLIMLPVILAIWCVALTLTFVISAINIGFGNGFLFGWMKSFLLTFCILAPLWITSTFVLDKVVNFIIPNAKSIIKKIVLAILMWCTIEFFVSFITVVNTTGFAVWFLHTWLLVYLKSIPIGICVWLFMSFIFKPWMWTRVEKMKALK